MALTSNRAVLAWIDEMAAMTQPDQLVWIDGSEAQLEELRKQACASGEIEKLNEEKLPGCYLHRTAVNDVARVEDRTFICCKKQEDAGPTNHWMDPQEMYAKLKKLYTGAMKGRTMYVIPYSMGVVGSPFAKYGIEIPTVSDWETLRDAILKDGIYNQNLQAVPPTGSISYINHSTSSIHPIASKIEIRKEGKLGRVYYPAAYMTNENLEYFRDAYEIGWRAIVDTYAEATQHVDQGLSLTLFFPDTATTRDLNQAQIYAWRKGIKTLYYTRIGQQALEGTEVAGCVSCML